MIVLPPYPRTLHLGDSGGGRSKHSCAFETVAGLHLVVEEKVDGSHCGLGFDHRAELQVFSRNTVFDHAPPRDFRPLVELAQLHTDALWEALGDRYVLYGEWAYVTHSIFYDALPAYFLEDDLFDRKTSRFLSTSKRRSLTSSLPPAFFHSVEVLHEGPAHDLATLHALIGPSRYKSDAWREACRGAPTVEDSDDMEGLYIKVEANGFVEQRLKWIRPEFLQHIASSAHWRDQPRRQNAMQTLPRPDESPSRGRRLIRHDEAVETSLQLRKP